MARFLVDTNILVYAYDPRDTGKSGISRRLLEILLETGEGALTPQVLGEFFRVVTRKIPAPLSPEEAERSVAAYVRTWTIHDISRWTVLEAARGVRQYRFAFWDSMIWASAKLHQVPNILSEDFNSGALIEGVRFVNPYAPGFQVEALLRPRDPSSGHV